MLLDYEYVKELLELDVRNEIFDRFILESVYQQVITYIGWNMELKEYSELLLVENYIAILSHYPLINIQEILDAGTNANVDSFFVDYEKRIVQFQPELNNHMIIIKYTAGYMEETFPADLKGAIIKLFIVNQNDFMNRKNGESINCQCSDIPEDVERILKLYSFKRL